MWWRPAMQHRLCLAILTLSGCTSIGPFATPGLTQAARNYPPMIIGGTVGPADGTTPRPCPAAGGRVEQRGEPTMTFLGADPSNPDLCRLRVGDDFATGWYGIWLTEWPGADEGHAALRTVINGRTGQVAGFDTTMAPTRRYHDLVRNEGIETIELLGKTYRAMKISHYREGLPPNDYRSVSTVWKDMPSGLLIYGTYQHISGAPELDDPIIPSAIVPGH